MKKETLKASSQEILDQKIRDYFEKYPFPGYGTIIVSTGFLQEAQESERYFVTLSRNESSD